MVALLGALRSIGLSAIGQGLYGCLSCFVTAELILEVQHGDWQCSLWWCSLL